MLLKFTLVLCELSGLHLVLHIICPAFNVCPLYEWAVRAKTLFCKIFALLLTFAHVSREQCEPYFVLYIIRRSKLFAPLCGSRRLQFCLVCFCPDSQPLPSFHVGFAGNSEFVCLFIFIFKTPFYFYSACSLFSCCASLFALLFYSFAYLPLDYTGSPAGASLFCLFYLILFAFSLPIFNYKSCLFIIALNLFLDFIIDVCRF